MSKIQEQLVLVQKAGQALASVSDKIINSLLLELADQIEVETKRIIIENQKDVAKMNSSDPKLHRLILTAEKIKDIAQGVRQVSALPSPVNVILEERTMSNGLVIQKKSVPLGVVGIIYEARPNVTPDVFSLCFKSGNACVLKGGSDAVFSHNVFISIIHQLLEKYKLDKNTVLLLPEGREEVKSLLEARGLVDVIIPRGGQGLINFVRDNSKVPVIETGAGVVHTYIDAEADIEMGKKIIENAKVSRPAACNALDTLIVHSAQLVNLGELVSLLSQHQVELWADSRALAALDGKYPKDLLKLATPEHFGLEFLSLKMAVKTVDSLKEALEHISVNGSKHSEAIVSKNTKNIEFFLDQVDAAAVYANAPTVFSDGGEFGLGAEVGISTQKLHARGPMGLQALTSYKWIVRGQGQIRR